MNQQEAAALLSVAAAFDNRKPDPDAATAWAVALAGLRFADCRDAIVAHYQRSSEWLMPQKVIAEVKRIRAARIAAFGPVDPPAGLSDADYTAWLRDTRRRIADGEQVARPVLESPADPDVVRRVGEFVRGALTSVDDA